MEKLIELDADQQRAWDDWLRGRPQIIRDLAEKFPPYYLYRIKQTGQHVVVVSYSEDGTMRVHVTPEYNPPWFEERMVFGIKPDDVVRVEKIPEPRQL